MWISPVTNTVRPADLFYWYIEHVLIGLLPEMKIMFQYSIPGVKPLSRKTPSMQMLIGKICGSDISRGDIPKTGGIATFSQDKAALGCDPWCSGTRPAGHRWFSHPVREVPRQRILIFIDLLLYTVLAFPAVRKFMLVWGVVRWFPRGGEGMCWTFDGDCSSMDTR